MRSFRRVWVVKIFSDNRIYNGVAPDTMKCHFKTHLDALVFFKAMVIKFQHIYSQQTEAASYISLCVVDGYSCVELYNHLIK